MAWVRKLPSGLWAATVRLPGDRKLTKSHKLKGTIEAWAAEQEADLRRGDWIDPRHGEMTVEAWWDRTRDSRVLELASRKRDASHWRVHVQPHWGRVPLSSILQPDVSTWVVKMQRRGVGADTIAGAVKVLRGLLQLAVAAKRIHFNPAAGVSLPTSTPSEPRILAPEEDQVVLDAFYGRFGDRCDAGLFVEFLMETGCRWEEAAGLSRAGVLVRKRQVRIQDVLERDGTIRHYAKTKAGNRPVPISDRLWPRLRDHALTRASDGLLFTGQRGGSLDYSRWLSRVWRPALTVVTERGGRNGMKILATRPLLDGITLTPHDLRHTYGTRLAEQGVPQHEIMALMGHDDPRASQRYMHAGEARFDRAREALEASRQTAGSSAAHDLAGRVIELPRNGV